MADGNDLNSNHLTSGNLARYMEETGGEFKPWLLLQLRLKKLQERRSHMDNAEYMQELADIHQDLMNLGEWWKGREAEVFGDHP
ncbi:MAG: hypothetical protein VKJ64_17320 [Leptolyngbyaceae bacterium]|nr:hypothetical protein [Leptolyngbyaceae bacterium]